MFRVEKKTSKGNEDVSVHTQTCEWNRLPASLMNIYVNFYFFYTFKIIYNFIKYV